VNVASFLVTASPQEANDTVPSMMQICIPIFKELSASWKKQSFSLRRKYVNQESANKEFFIT
jgi:hypothetical protein